MASVTTADEALRIAEEECVRRSLPWSDPHVRRGWRSWKVWTPAGQKGGNAIVYVSKRDGSTKVRHFDR